MFYKIVDIKESENLGISIGLVQFYENHSEFKENVQNSNIF